MRFMLALLLGGALVLLSVGMARADEPVNPQQCAAGLKEFTDLNYQTLAETMGNPDGEARKRYVERYAAVVRALPACKLKEPTTQQATVEPRN